MSGFRLNLTADTPVIVQGIAGAQGSSHTKEMLKFGTNVVAGVDPGHGGTSVAGLPVFDSIGEAKAAVGQVAWSVVFVPAPFAKDACMDALHEGLNIVVVTEGIPVHDTIEILQVADRMGRQVIGPNGPGVAIPGVSKLGIFPNEVLKSGAVGVVSRSGTLTYEVLNYLSRANLGQRAVVGLGGDEVPGISFIPVLEWFERDPRVREILLIGEIGTDLEQQAAQFIHDNVTKPTVAYIAGRYAPIGKRMGHAGAIVLGDRHTAQSKITALEQANVAVAKSPWDVPKLLGPRQETL